MIFQIAKLSPVSPLFIDIFYFRSATARWTNKKTFKRFPVELDFNYYGTILEGHINGDLKRMDVLVEVVNILFFLEEERVASNISLYLYNQHESACMRLLQEVNITVK